MDAETVPLREGLLLLAEHLETKAKKAVVDPLILALAVLLARRFRAQANVLLAAFRDRVPLESEVRDAVGDLTAKQVARFDKAFLKALDQAYQAGADVVSTTVNGAAVMGGNGVRKPIDFLAEIDSTTLKKVESIIKTAYKAAAADGRTPALAEIRGQVSALFKDWAGADAASRSMGIALSEISGSFHQGMLDAARSSGTETLKRWDVDPEACDICTGNAGEEIALDEPFASGDDAPPAHFRCRCSLTILEATPDR